MVIQEGSLDARVKSREILDKMDAAAEEARIELVKLIAQYPEAITAVGKWANTYYPTAGYKRLAKLLTVLGK